MVKGNDGIAPQKTPAKFFIKCPFAAPSVVQLKASTPQPIVIPDSPMGKASIQGFHESQIACAIPKFPL